MSDGTEFEKLLAACTPLVHVDNKPVGTAFYVAPGWAITAAHVVKWPEIQVKLVDSNAMLTGRVAQVWPDVTGSSGVHGLPDLALIKVDGTDHPCVRLSDRTPSVHTTFMVYGHTNTYGRDRVRPEITANLRYSGLLDDPEDTGTTLYKLAEGAIVPGMSGAPVVDMGTETTLGSGDVVGMTRTGQGGPFGGWVVRSHEIRSLLGDRIEGHDEFHRADSRWTMAWRRSGVRHGSFAEEPDEVWWHGRSIAPFATLRARRDDRGRFLDSEHLEYLELPHTDFQPGPLLDRLASSERLGVLVVARAGEGKTRLCVETAKQASERNWPVWFTRSPGHEAQANALTVDDLRRAVSSRAARSAGHVLLILDYLDSYHQALRPEEIRRLIDDASLAGVRVMLLATCRPGAENSLRTRFAATVLDVEHLPSPRKHRVQLANRILTRVAPTAVERLGLDHVRHQCAGRPAPPLFTLLLALAFERGHSSPSPLFTWLRDRLIYDKIVPPSDADGLSNTDVIAFALAAATCRRRLADLTATVKAVMTALGPATQFDHVDRLEETGWLLVLGDAQAMDPEYDLLHDSVADLLLDAALFPTGTNTPAANVINAALDAVAADPVALERFCVHFARVFDLQNAQRMRNLRRLCAQWLDASAQKLGERIGSWGADGQRGVFALLHHRPWSSGEPWEHADGRNQAAEQSLLANHFDTIVGTQPTSGVVIESLRTTPGWGPEHAALIWLANNADDASNAAVLTHLLSRTLDDEDVAASSCAYAIAWLRDHPDHPGFSSLAVACLHSRQMLVSEHELELVGHATAAAAARSPQANDLYAALLEHEALAGTFSDTTADRALAHAESIPLAFSIGMVLNRLTGTPSGSRLAGRILALALPWLDRHLRAGLTPYLVQALLDLAPWVSTDALNGLVNRALVWLSRNLEDTTTPHVLRRLLKVRRLTPDQKRRIAQQTVRWADLLQHQDEGVAVFHPQAYYLLPQVVRLVNKDDVESPRTVQNLFAMLEKRCSTWTPSHAYILHALLTATLPVERAQRTIAMTKSWLDEHAGTRQAVWVYQGLFRSTRVPAADYAGILPGAEEWLLRNGCGTSEAQYLINAALRQPALTDEQRQVVSAHAEAVVATETETKSGPLAEIDAALVAASARPRRGASQTPPKRWATIDELAAWLAAHQSEHEFGYVAIRLMRKRPPATVIQRLMPAVVTWLAAFADRGTAPLLLRLLLFYRTSTEVRMRQVEAELLVPTAVAWLHEHPSEGRAGGVLAGLLTRGNLDDAGLADVKSIAKCWLVANQDLRESGLVIDALLQVALPADDIKQVVRWAIQWLTARPEDVFTGSLAHTLLSSGLLRVDQRKKVIHPVLQWLDTHGPVTPVGLQLVSAWGRTMSHVTLTRGEADRLATHARAAIERLDRPGHDRPTAFNLNGCMDCALSADSIDPLITQPLVVRAIGWLEHDVEVEHYGYRLGILLGRKHLTVSQIRHVLSLATAWLSDKELEAKDTRPLQRMLRSRHLTPEQVAVTERQAMAWLRKFSRETTASHLLLHLLRREDLSAEILDEALDLGLSWLGQGGGEASDARTAQALLRRPELAGRAAGDFVTRMLDWVERGTKAARVNVLIGVLSRPDLGAGDEQRALGAAVSALSTDHMDRADGLLLDILLDHAADDRWWPAARDLALAWLDQFHRVPSAPYVIRPLVADRRLDERTRIRLVQMTVDWLPEFWTRNACPEAILAIVDSGVPLDAYLTTIAQYGLVWLEARARLSGETSKAVNALVSTLVGRLSTVQGIEPRSLARIRQFAPPSDDQQDCVVLPGHDE